MKIFYVYRTERKKLLEDSQKGINHTTFLYGLPELKSLKFTVDFSDLAFQKSNLLRYILFPIEKLHSFLINYPIGFKLHQAILLWPLYRTYDVIVTTQDSAGLPFLLLKKLGLINSKIIYISNSLANALSTPRFSFMNHFIKLLLKSADSIICYSKKEQEILNKFVNRPVIFIPFGVDIKFFEPQKKKSVLDIDVLSAGRDSFRDYQSLFKAVRNKNWKVTLACGPENIRNLKVPSNITLLFNIEPLQMRELYQRTKLVVIPMKNTHKTQGQVVFMEAVAMGKPIIASHVSGLTHGYSLKEYPQITLVNPESASDLRQAIHQQLTYPKRTLKTNMFRDSISTHIYAKKLANIIYTVVEG